MVFTNFFRNNFQVFYFVLKNCFLWLHSFCRAWWSNYSSCCECRSEKCCSWYSYGNCRTSSPSSSLKLLKIAFCLTYFRPMFHLCRNQVIDLHLYLNVTLPHVFFKHFASKNQLTGFCTRGALVGNGLRKIFLRNLNEAIALVEIASFRFLWKIYRSLHLQRFDFT